MLSDFFGFYLFDELTLKNSHYDFLGVSPSADAETLHQAFRRLSKELHPDTTALPSKDAAQQFQQLCEAYETLSDPSRRKIYDKSLVPKTSSISRFTENSNLSANFSSQSVKRIELRRPLSGGELFALILLVLTFVLSLLVGLAVGLAQGRELQVRPSWMLPEQTIGNVQLTLKQDVSVASYSDSS